MKSMTTFSFLGLSQQLEHSLVIFGSVRVQTLLLVVVEVQTIGDEFNSLVNGFSWNQEDEQLINCSVGLCWGAQIVVVQRISCLLVCLCFALLGLQQFGGSIDGVIVFGLDVQQCRDCSQDPEEASTSDLNISHVCTNPSVLASLKMKSFDLEIGLCLVMPRSSWLNFKLANLNMGGLYLNMRSWS